MNIGQARTIFEQIFDDKYSDEEKGMAILQVLNATGGNIRKERYRQVVAWLWGKCFRIEEVKEQEHECNKA